MSIRDEARAALAAFDRAGVDTVLTKIPALVAALRALLDETEPAISAEAGARFHEIAAQFPVEFCSACDSPSLPCTRDAACCEDCTHRHESGTPEPTPDERVYLWELIGAEITPKDAIATQGEYDEIDRAVDAVLAAGFHRQGPITDDTEWEYGVAFPEEDGTWNTEGQEFESLEAAREDFEKEMWLDSDRIVRRRKAGPWEPVS